MASTTLYTVSDAAKELDRQGNRQLLASLIEHHQIPTFKVGPSLAIDHEGLAALKKAVELWDNRPRVSRKLAAPASR